MAKSKGKSGKKSPKKWDAIIIGSGMGGMAAACALSKTGHKVLLLEQYPKLGGQTHSFSRDGFSWDVGIHYMSEMSPESRARQLLDWLCDTPIDFAPIGAIYDVLHIGDQEPLTLSRPFEAQAMDLKERFPEEHEAINAWFAAVHKGRDAAWKMSQTRGMPQPLGMAIKWWNGSEIEKWCGRTTKEVADEITDNDALKAAFYAQWGDHGGRPSTASFALHALIANDYLDAGAWYPVGGASSIADHMLPTISKAGGEARAGVRVEKLLMKDGEVVGVRTTDGEEIGAKKVISDIGAYETVSQLLPDGHDEQDWVDEITSMRPAICHFSLFLGFEGDIKDAGATKANHWIYPKAEMDAVWSDAPDGRPPVIFLSFASLKDADHDPGPKQQNSGEIVAWTDWSVVGRWAGMPPGSRGEDYSEFKEAVKEKMLAELTHAFPELAKLVVFSELSTPLATASITGHRQGGFYGLENSPRRMMSDALRMKTPIKGLLLAGQDVLTPGIPGALWSGVICAGNVDPKIFSHFPAKN